MRILLMSNSVRGRYGYSNVAGPVGVGLAQAGHEVIRFGMQTIAPPHYGADGLLELGLINDPWGSEILADYLKAYKIDLLITICDLWLPQIQYIPGVVKSLKIPWIGHITINTYPLSPFFSVLPLVDIIVAPSKFNYNILIEAGVKHVEYIPHGIDTTIFDPCSIPDLKEELKLEDKFCFFSVMRNKGYQKDFYSLFKAYKIFLERNKKAVENSKLVVLTDPTESEGLNLYHLRNYFGLQTNVQFLFQKPEHKTTEYVRGVIHYSGLAPTFEGDPEGFQHRANNGFSIATMAELYNIMDCTVISSQGESFCLPLIESMACGKPVIAPNFSAPVELITESKAGLLANTKSDIPTPIFSSVKIVDENSLAQCMEKMYLDKDFREECGRNGVEYARAYDWKRVISRWTELIKKFEQPKECNYIEGEMGL